MVLESWDVADEEPNYLGLPSAPHYYAPMHLTGHVSLRETFVIYQVINRPLVFTNCPKAKNVIQEYQKHNRDSPT